MDRKSEKGVIPAVALVIVLIVAGIVAVIYYKSTYQVPNTTSNVQVFPLQLTLESPTEGAIIADSKITVKGKTNPGVTVAIYTEVDENSLEVDSNGNFEGQVGLADGINSLTVTAFAENGDEKTLNIDLVNDTK